MRTGDRRLRCRLCPCEKNLLRKEASARSVPIPSQIPRSNPGAAAPRTIAKFGLCNNFVTVGTTRRCEPPATGGYRIGPPAEKLSPLDRTVLITGGTGRPGGRRGRGLPGCRMARGRDLGRSGRKGSVARRDGPGAGRGRPVRRGRGRAGGGSAASRCRSAPLRAVANLVGGYAAGPRVHETPVEDFERLFTLNLRPAFLVTQAAVPPHLVRAGGGGIVCVSARAALQPFPGAAGYASSKAAVIAFAKTVAAEYRDEGVRCNAILPSVIDTPPTAPRSRMPTTRAGSRPPRSRGSCGSCAQRNRRLPVARPCRCTAGLRSQVSGRQVPGFLRRALLVSGCLTGRSLGPLPRGGSPRR